MRDSRYGDLPVGSAVWRHARGRNRVSWHRLAPGARTCGNRPAFPVPGTAGAPGPGNIAADDVLRALAEQTHGLYTTIYTSASYAIALDRLADRLATEMLIEYQVPGGAPLAGDVRVGVRIPGARATGLGVSK